MASTLTDTVALVTGGSSGIGEATARKRAELGASVALVARRKDRLDALAAEIESVTHMVSRPRRASIAELWIMPTDQA